MTTFLLPLLAVAVGTIVALAVRDKRAARTDREEAEVDVIRAMNTIRPTREWMDWDAISWWQYGVLWDDYDPLP